MRNLCIVVMFIVSSTLIQGYNVDAASLDQLFQLPFSKKELSKVDWKDINSVDRFTKKWPAFTGENKVWDFPVIKQWQFNYSERDFIAAVLKTKTGYSIAMMQNIDDFENAISNRDISKLFDMLENSLGRPAKQIDLSRNAGRWNDLNRKADWLLDGTRVRLRGLGAEADGKPVTALIYLTIEDRNANSDLQDLVYLKLDGKMVGLLNGKEITSTPTSHILILDLDSNRLLRRDKSVYAQKLVITDDSISGAWEEKDARNSLKIDRVLGTFEITTCYKKGLGQEYIMRGSVEKYTEAPKRKF